MSAAQLLLGVVFSSLGFAFFRFGRKRGSIVQIACGALLMIAPYFISSALLLLITGGVLTALPFFVVL